jgi:hypothetical protein
MRNLAYAAAFAAVFGIASYSVAQTKGDHEPGGMTKGEPIHVYGTIIKTYKDERLIQLKVERDLGAAGAGGAEHKDMKDEKSAEKGGEKSSGKLMPPKEGEIIFLHVADARFRDLREKKGWFGGKKEEGEVGVDKGWKLLDDGYRVRCECVGQHEMAAPKGFPKEARAGGNILVYHVSTIEVLGEKGTEKK